MLEKSLSFPPSLQCDLDGAQAYATPPWFHDDWLNGFYDQRRQSAGCQPPPCSFSHTSERQHANIAVKDSGKPWLLQDNPLAQSDYRFVYLGVKVCFWSAALCRLPCYRSCARSLSAHLIVGPRYLRSVWKPNVPSTDAAASPSNSPLYGFKSDSIKAQT